MRGVPQTPTRRSKRGQPIVTFPTRLSEQSEGIKWSGEQIHVRPMQPELDMLPERLQLWQEQEEEERREYDAVFYNSFQQETRGSQPATFSVGQTVAVSTQALYKRDKAPSIAVIIAMWELVARDQIEAENENDEDEDPKAGQMMVRVHWFLRPTELAAIRVKREHGENEIYYSTTSSEILIPSAISASCTVTSDVPHPVASSSKSAPRRRWAYAEDNKKIGPFYCRVAVDARRGLYYKFDWLAHHQQASTETEDPWGSGNLWNIDSVETAQNTPSQTKTNAKAKGKQTVLRAGPKRAKRITVEADALDHMDVDGGSDDNPDDEEYTKDSDSDADEDDDVLPTFDDFGSDGSKSDADEPKTPSKKRRRNMAHPTPHSKAALARRSKGTSASPRKRAKIAVRSNNASLGCDSTADLPKDPWLRAMHVLHVGSRPDALPCRETEFDNVLDAVSNILEEGSGGCVYISGVPGTGKTATVHAVVRELKRMAESNETNPFTYVEINGLRIPEPTAAYTLLWEAVSGHDATTEGSLRMSAKESLKALTTHFSGGGGRGRGPGGHACVVLMDELDQLMTAKQDVVYNFFNWPTLVGSKLVVVAVANTMDLPERAMTGRVRSRLGMKRINFQPYTALQLQTIVEARLASAAGEQDEDAGEVLQKDAIKLSSMKVSGVSGDARRMLDICRRAVELAQPTRRKAIIKDIHEVMRVMQNSPTAAYLRECSFHERMMLAALVKCIKREGVDEIKWGEVKYQHLTYVKVIEDPTVRTLREPTPNELALVLDSLLAARALIMEGGATALRKAEGDRKVILNLEQGEVERVLGDVGGEKWRNILTS